MLDQDLAETGVAFSRAEIDVVLRAVQARVLCVFCSPRAGGGSVPLSSFGSACDRAELAFRVVPQLRRSVFDGCVGGV